MNSLNNLLKKNSILFIIILITGTVLRFWDYSNVPFTYDEFSALFRTQYTSFSQLIKEGVMPDGHPAGIQVFLYYWVKLVGFSEVWIKLPFTLMGLASLWLIWRISIEWFSEKVALLSTSTLAFMQYFIMYSQIARPYVSGMFFTLLMVMYWYRLLFKSDLTKTKLVVNTIGFVISATLCSYNHYFSLLMVVLVGVLGFFYLNKGNYKRYIFALFVVFVLYIPHIKIFIYQFSLKGLGWLSVPKPSFFADFLNYLMHFNSIALIFWILLFVLGLVLSFAFKEKFSKSQFIALFLGITPALIGYVYSLYRAPVLQYSVLIFSVPFFFLFNYSLLNRLKLKLIYAIVVFWSFLLIYSLIFERNYYHYFYNSIYSETFKEIQLNKDDSTLVLCGGFNHKIGNYYVQKLKLADTSNIVYTHLLTKKRIYEYLSNPKYNKVIMSSVTNGTPWLYALIHEYYPHTIMEKYLDQGEIRILKKGTSNYDNYLFFSLNSFTTESGWNYKQENTKNDTIGAVYYVIRPFNEYDVQFEFNNKNEIQSYSQIIDIGAWVYLPDQFNGKAHLVACIEKDSMLLWQSFVIDANELPKRNWIPIATSIFLPDFSYSLDSIKVKTYFWNPELQEFYVSKTFFGIRKGNPTIYWIYKNRL